MKMRIWLGAVAAFGVSAAAHAQTPTNVVVGTASGTQTVFAPETWSAFVAAVGAASPAASGTTAGTVPNLGGASGAAVNDATSHLAANELPTNVLTTAAKAVASGLATLDATTHLAAAQLPTGVLTTASEGTAAGNVPVVGSAGTLPCALIPLGSGVACNSGSLTATGTAAAAATSTTAGTVPNLGGNSGAAATDATGRLVAGELPTSALTASLEGAASGIATLDGTTHLTAAQLPTSVLTTAAEGTAAGNVPVVGSAGTLPCALIPLGSGVACSGGALTATGGGGTAAAATSTTAGTVPNLGGNSGAAATDSTGRLVAGELPTSALTTALEGAASGLATLDSSSHLLASQLPTGVLTTAAEGTAAGNIALLGTGGLFGCALLPVDGSTVTCSSGKLVASGGSSTFTGGTISGSTTVANNLLVQGGSSSTSYSLQANIPSANPYASAFGVFRTNASGNNPGGSAMYIRDENQSGSFSQYCCGINNGNSALQIDRILDSGSNGSQIGTTVNMTVAASNPFSDEDVGYNIQGNKVGNATDSLWGISGEINDQTGAPPQSFSALGYEFDIAANGQDQSASAYDGQNANRFGYYFAPKVFWGGLNPGFTWAASTAVSAANGSNNATITVQTDTAGTSRIYKVTTAGTTGTAKPTWPVSGTVTDGSAVWTEEETTAVEVGTGLWLDNGEDSRTSYGTGIGTNGAYQNAVIDTSLATMMNNGTAALRVAANQPIDLSGNSTAAGQNQHVLEYSTAGSQNALVYNVANATVLKIADASNWLYDYGPATLGIANMGGVSSGFPTTGTTFGWNKTGGGQESDEIVGQGGLNIYPVGSTGTIPGVPAFSVTAAGNATIAGTATVTGNASFGGLVASRLATGVAAASITVPASGTAPAGATQLASSVTHVTTCSTAAAGSTAAPLQLPAGAAVGSFTIRVLNRSSTTCAVYPPSGGTIESNAANVPVTIAAGQDFTFVSLSASAWDE